MASCQFASLFPLPAWLLPLSTPALTTSLPLVSPNDDGQLQFPMTRILLSYSLCCSLSLTAQQVATVDNTGSFFVFQMFLQLSRLFGIQSSSLCGRRIGGSALSSLLFRPSKQRMATFTQTKKGSLNACLHLLNSLLVIAAAALEAAPQNPALKMRCGASLYWGSYWSSHWVDLLVLTLPLSFQGWCEKCSAYVNTF